MAQLPYWFVPAPDKSPPNFGVASHLLLQWCISLKIQILLMVQKSGDRQLRLVVSPIIYRVFIHPRWDIGFLQSTLRPKKGISPIILFLGWD